MKNFSNIWFVLLISMFVLGASNAAYAQEGNDKDEGDWEIMVGATVLYEPKTEGSNQYQFKPEIIFEAIYKDRFFVSSDNGVGAFLLTDDEREIGIALKRGDDRNQDDDILLFQDLPDINKGLALNAFAAQEFGDLGEISVDIVYDFGAARGLYTEISLGHTIDINNKTSAEFEVGSVWASGNVLNTLYGVTNEQSSDRTLARNSNQDLVELSAISISAQFYEITADIALEYRIDDKWSTQLGVGYTRFLGDVAKSSLTRKDTEIVAQISILRRF